MNVDSKISEAISSEYKTIKTNTNINYALGRALVMVSNKGADSSFVRVEHNIAAPDPIQNNVYNFRLNSQHYWKVDGILSNGFVAKLRFNFDGGKVKSGNSYLDTSLIIVNSDSLILLYRKNASDDWKELSHYTKMTFGAKVGNFTVDTLKFGEYVFANGHSNILTSVKNKQSQVVELNLYPNPSSTILNVAIVNYKLSANSSIDIYDMQGKVVKHLSTINPENTIWIEDLAPGQYILNLVDKSKKVAAKTFVVE